jgi:hypothetical protein
MRVAVYGAVLVIALGSVLLGLDWLSAPMSPMVDTQAGLQAVAPPPVVATPAPVAQKATIGAPIVPPALVAPGGQNASAPPSAPPQPEPQAPIATESQVPCNVAACTAAYRSFRASDCTYLQTSGLRKLCTK